MNHLYLASPSRVEGSADGEVIRGVASSIGNIDYAGRVFLPGAFGQESKKVPFLLNHEEVPLGESVLTPTPQGLRHESRIIGEPTQPKTGVPIRQLLRSGYNATSIGWVDKGSYFGWRAFERAEPDRAKEMASLGIPQYEDARYFVAAEIVENSLCPIGANPQALLDAASVLPGKSEERGYLLGLAQVAQEQAADAPPTKALTPPGPVQELHDSMASMHDTTVAMGAACGGHAYYNGANLQVYQPTTPSTLTATNPSWTTTTTNYSIAAPSKPKKARFSMPNGSYPINNCSDVSDAAHLVGHSKTYSRDQVARMIRRAAKALNCSLPDSWNSNDGESSSASLEGVEKAEITEDELQRESIQAVDACVDEAIQELRNGDTEQALALLIAADETVDGLMEDMNIKDPEDRDEDEGQPAAQAAKAEPLTLYEITALERELADLTT